MKQELRAKMEKTFDIVSDKIAEMKLEIVGVIAVVTEEDSLDWVTDTRIYGSFYNYDKDGMGWNTLAIAWSKAAEMVQTHQDSGSNCRPKMMGELAYQGGATEKYGNGHIVIAFSGGTSEEDFEISKYAIEVFKGL